MAPEAGRSPPVHRLESVDSTNAEALRRLAAGLRAPHVIWALRQTAGRGRDGRLWSSPPGNLYATLVAVVPEGRAVGELSFVAAVAAGEAILACCAGVDDLRYKWPNDVLSGGRKLAGVLIEGDGRNGLAIGIGINVASAPERVTWPATCLQAAGGEETTVEALLEALVAAWDARFAAWEREGFAPVRDAWLARAFGIGEDMRARMPDGAVYDGVFRTLDGDGALLLDQGAAGMRRIAAGEIMAGAH